MSSDRFRNLVFGPWAADRQRGLGGLGAVDVDTPADSQSAQESMSVQDTELACAPELHRDIEASVRRSMTVPDLSGLLQKIDRAAAQMREGGRASVEGSIRWVAAAASLLFLCLAMCASTLVPAALTGPSSESQGVPSARGNWRVSLVQAMGLSLATASAVVASGAKLRRGGRRQSQRIAGSRIPSWAEQDGGLRESPARDVVWSDCRAAQGVEPQGAVEFESQPLVSEPSVSEPSVSQPSESHPSESQPVTPGTKRWDASGGGRPAARRRAVSVHRSDRRVMPRPGAGRGAVFADRPRRDAVPAQIRSLIAA